MRVPSQDDSNQPLQILTAVSETGPAITPTPQIGGISSQMRTVASIEISAIGIRYGAFPGFHPMDWSPDGRSLAYTKDNKVWIQEISQDVPKEVLSISEALLSGVYYSPDGTHLALTGMQASPAPGVDSSMVWTMRTTGEALQDASIALGIPTLAKFGKQWLSDNLFAFTIWGGNGIQRLYTVDPESNRLEKLIQDQQVVSGRTLIGGEYYFSRDSTLLAIQSPFRDQIAVLPLDSPAEGRWLVPESTMLQQEFQSWMPNSDDFLFTQWENGDPTMGAFTRGVELWRGSGSTGKVEKVLDDVVAASPSPDGTQIAFLRQQDQEWGPARAIGLNESQSAGVTALEFGIYDSNTGTVKLIAPAGYKREDVADDHLRYWQIARPVWSPNGRFLAYWGGDSNLWIASRDEYILSQVTVGPEVVQVVWSPTSTHLAMRAVDHAWVIQTPGQ